MIFQEMCSSMHTAFEYLAINSKDWRPQSFQNYSFYALLVSFICLWISVEWVAPAVVSLIEFIPRMKIFWGSLYSRCLQGNQIYFQGSTNMCGLPFDVNSINLLLVEKGMDTQFVRVCCWWWQVGLDNIFLDYSTCRGYPTIFPLTYCRWLHT